MPGTSFFPRAVGVGLDEDQTRVGLDEDISIGGLLAAHPSVPRAA